jgi:glycerol-3-phosphate dehydrogenase (NAD(P)+)
MGVGLAVGMMEAAGPDRLANMYNPQAGLFGQACYEMQKLVDLLSRQASGVANGANGANSADGSPSPVTWLPGAGDLYVTVFGGRTVRLGKLLGQGKTFAEARALMAGETLESVEIITRVARALPKLSGCGLLDLRDFPLLLHMDRIVNHGETVSIPWDAFFHGA